MPKPYYEDEFITLYHGSCIGDDASPWWTADVLVTDPPYGMGLKSGRFNGKVGGFGDLYVANDEDTAARDAALEAWGERPGIAFGRWSIERPKGTKQVLIWEKGDHTGMGDLNIPWRPSTEEIYVLGKWPPRPNSGRGGGGRVSPVYRVMAPTPGKQNGRNHPTEKPVALMERLIEKCPPGVIADPFAGSGSTLVAAKNLGRKAIGVELEERYCEVAAKRLSQEVLDLFAAA